MNELINHTSISLTEEQKIAMKNMLVPAILMHEHIAGPWTKFMDMHSGGGCKQSPFEFIYIQADESDARIIFYNIFHRFPDHVTCGCCGDDYSIAKYVDLSQVSGSERKCDYVKVDGTFKYIDADSSGRFNRGVPFIPLEKYVYDRSVLCIFANVIKPEWRIK